jgi:hypothetical protein
MLVEFQKKLRACPRSFKDRGTTEANILFLEFAVGSISESPTAKRFDLQGKRDRQGWMWQAIAEHRKQDKPLALME